MKKIIAIGGGEIGRPGYPVQTTSIDNEIIKLAGKKKPKLLFIPTASSDSEKYYETVKKHFGARLGCETKVLYLINSKQTKKEIRKTILSADIIYVGGGNTEKMLKIWRKRGVDKFLETAYNRGIVLSGLSAGAICWFRWGNSDSRRFVNPKADLIKVNGLNFVNALLCPHYDVEKDRRKDLKKMLKKVPCIAIALDNCCAIEILNKEYRIICSKASAKAHKVYWKAGKYFEEIIQKRNDFQLIEMLLKK